MTALRGARQWQQRAPSSRYLAGAVLFSPYSFAFIPPLGTAPEYLPIVESTNIPLMIYQAGDSAVYGQFETLLQKLRKHGSPVYTRLVPEVMSLFYEDPPTEAMVQGAQPLPHNIRAVLPLLAQHDYPLQAVPLAGPAASASGIDIHLREYGGRARPGPIELDDIFGKSFSRSDFSGKVTLVNFWATWCPPCIEEIPSLNRLKRKLAGRPFELISINYAQDRDTVLEFLRRVRIEFPVLLDANGELATAWQVISYPSTFVIDKSGNIRYGVNAAIDWDTPESIGKLESLMR
jgi:thiol-disulfide isomerase/thioredoxin